MALSILWNFPLIVPGPVTLNRLFVKSIYCQATGYWFWASDKTRGRRAHCVTPSQHVSCETHWVGRLHAAALCRLLTKSFTQLLLSGQPQPYTTAAPLRTWLRPHCLLAYEIASAERTVTHREEKCVHLWEQRKWTTQEPLSQPHSPRATTSGWYERKIEFEEWRTKSPARESARVCVCVCTNRTQVRHLVDQAWQGSHQTILDLRERTSQIIYEKESLKSVPYMEINTSVKLVKCWLFSFLLNV